VTLPLEPESDLDSGDEDGSEIVVIEIDSDSDE
jgi:hypothetical protein